MRWVQENSDEETLRRMHLTFTWLIHQEHLCQRTATRHLHLPLTSEYTYTMPAQAAGKQDLNVSGQEASDFPILCETCLGPNRTSCFSSASLSNAARVS